MTHAILTTINIHEFEDKNPFYDKNAKKINIINKLISFNSNNNQTIASFTYSRKSNLTKFIALQVNPFFNISHFVAKFEYPINNIELNDGIWKSIDNLITNKIFFFYIEVMNYVKINISLIINNTDNEYNEYELPNFLDNRTIIRPYLKKDSIPDYIDINVYEYKNNIIPYTSYFHKSIKTLNKEKENYFKTQS